MLNASEVHNSIAGHTAGLIMHWIDECSDPKAHPMAGGSTMPTNPLPHWDHLEAVWIEPNPALPRTAQ